MIAGLEKFSDKELESELQEAKQLRSELMRTEADKLTHAYRTSFNDMRCNINKVIQALEDERVKRLSTLVIAYLEKFREE